MMRSGPIRLAIRQDDEAGVIYAYFYKGNDEDDCIVVGTLSLTISRELPGLFGAWKEAMVFALKGFYQQSGVEVEKVVAMRPPSAEDN